MTVEAFNALWQATWPETIPLYYTFRDALPDKWFRIHSLPNSQRYAAGQEDWEILLHRQNTLITDVVGCDAPLLMVTYTHSQENDTTSAAEEPVTSITHFTFSQLAPINLYEFNPEHYCKGQFALPMFTELNWQPHQHNAILRDVANWELLAFFVSFQHKCLLAPYDGGMDIILADTATRDHYKAKYAAWLSTHESGL